MRPEDLARLFHETYERLAPDHGYKTRKASAVPWEDVPAANKALMIAVAGEVLPAIRDRVTEAIEAKFPGDPADPVACGAGAAAEIVVSVLTTPTPPPGTP